MPKILIINSCLECPYLILGGIPPVPSFCDKTVRRIDKKEEIPKGCPLEEEDNKLRAKWFEKGQLSVKRKNESGCICIINDADEIVEVCLAHKAWSQKVGAEGKE